MTRLALVATGSVCEPQQAEQVVKLLTQRGFDVTHDDNLYTRRDAQARAAHFLQALLDDTLDAIWVMRGGEGSADVLPFLHEHQADITEAKPKVLLGFSDFTPILNYMAQTYHWPAHHGMGALQVLPGYVNESTLVANLSVLQGEKSTPLLDAVALNDAARATNEVTGIWRGGNMSLLNISVGDVWELDLKDKIVFIEDWHEKGHVIDRTLKYFERLGWFGQAKALVLGDFLAAPVGPDEATQTMQRDYINRVLVRFAARQSVPVLQTNSVGHGKQNYPVAMHDEVKLVWS